MSKETDKTEVPEKEEAPELPETPEAGEAPETAELPESGEAVEPEEHHPVNQSSGSNGIFLALVIIALAAIGGSVYLWQQQKSLHRETQTLRQDLDRLHGLVEERHSSQQKQIETLAKHQHPQTEEQLRKIESQVQDIRGRVGQERREWAVAEVEFLLRIARDSLSLEHDRDTSLAALRQARDRLNLLKQDIYQPVIQQIDEDIDKLTAVTLPDRNRIAAQLGTLSAAVEGWPLAISEYSGKATAQASKGTAEEEQQVAEGGGWRQVMAKIWLDIRSLVSIRHNGEVTRPLLEPEQRYFLKQNLMLKLETARLALLSGNSNAYRDSLTEAAAWIKRYYDTSAPQVGQAQTQIEQLATVDLEPVLPQLGRSIELLHQAAMQAAPKAQPKPAASAPPAKKVPAKSAAGKAKPEQGKASPAKPAAETPASAPATTNGTGTEPPAKAPAPGAGTNSGKADSEAVSAPTEPPAAEAPAPSEGSGQ